MTLWALERHAPYTPQIDRSLRQHARNLGNSQGGEDGILEHIFTSILPVEEEEEEEEEEKEEDDSNDANDDAQEQRRRRKWHGGRQPVVVEVGSWDGVHLSNSRHLVHRLGWSGVLVEGDPARSGVAANLYSHRPDVLSVCAMVSFPGDAAIVAAASNGGKGSSGSGSKGKKTTTKGKYSTSLSSTPPTRTLAEVLDAVEFGSFEEEEEEEVEETTSGSNNINFSSRNRRCLAEDFEVLSIDIDGADYWVWEGLIKGGESSSSSSSSSSSNNEKINSSSSSNNRKKWRPQVVVVEFNPTIPNHVSFVQEKSSATHHGSSLRALVELGERLGYALVTTTTFNGVFVDAARILPRFEAYYRRCCCAPPPEEEGSSSYSPSKFSSSSSSSYSSALVENRIDWLHVPSMTSDLFQLYDGTLVLAGCRKLLWHGKRLGGRPIGHEELQV